MKETGGWRDHPRNSGDKNNLSEGRGEQKTQLPLANKGVIFLIAPKVNAASPL